MSAWSEAVWIIKQLHSELDIDKKINLIKNKYLVAAKKKEDSWSPDVPEFTENNPPSNGSLWFIIEEEE